VSKKIPARAASPRVAPPPIELDARLTIVQAAELHRTMAARLEGSWPVVVDGTRVEEIDTAVLQLLTSLWCTGKERGIACTWRGASDALRRSAALIGVAGILQLDAAA
jgi:anti-anti-sigma regulatory factor